MIYEFGVDIGPMYLTIAVEYKVYPGEPMVRYYPDGSGYPGSPPELEIVDVVVTSVSGDTYDYNVSQLGDWSKDLDRIAAKLVESGRFNEELFENASNYE